MEEDQELKHKCKLCDKSFPCGRSLGGHMRSHVIYPTDQEKLQKMKKLPSVNNGTGNNPFIDATGYGLRENPKKTCRFKDSSVDTLLHHDKLCRECGKAFQSWKALFGHMKCHSDKITQACVEEHGSWTSADQSDNGTANPNRKKRSSRRTKRYNNMDITANSTSSSLSLSFNANASSSVSEIEQEQEEVAMCLIMLSKDLSHWGGQNFIGESTDNNSDFIEIGFCATEDCPKMDRSEAQVAGLIVNEKLKKSQVVEELEFQVSDVEMQKNLINKSESDQKAEMGTKKHHNSSKRKGDRDLFDPELGVNCQENFGKKSKFECSSCNKAFNTYQALGGHRASHKKMKGCFGLKPDGSENSSIGADQNLSLNPTADKNSPIDQEMAADTSNGTKKINKEWSHKCPICFRVFSSGQALGGHKRSHLIAEAKNNQNVTSIVIQKPIPEVRDFLDLNLPAPDEEDSNTSGLGFNPWWIGSNHKHEPLLSLL